MRNVPEAIQNRGSAPVTVNDLAEAVRKAVSEASKPPESYTMPGVGQFFGVHPQTCRKWVKRGILPPPAIKVGRTVRWSRAQLEAVLAAGVTA